MNVAENFDSLICHQTTHDRAFARPRPPKAQKAKAERGNWV